MTRTDRNLSLLLLGAFLLGVSVAAATGAFADRPIQTSEDGQPPENGPSAPASALADPAAAAVDPLPLDESVRRTPVVEAAERVSPAVVSITSETAQRSWLGTQTASSAGSGVVINPDGVVLTNAHVVKDAFAIKASFVNGASYDATILGMDEDLDLAVLRLVGARGLVAVPIGSSAGLMLGEPVIAIGNPYGLGHTVTTGVVSSLHRSLETRSRVFQDFLQTDASINPGNSGGPLLDLKGRLIGINTAIYAEGQNIGFAIPSDRAMKIAGDLLQFGNVVAPWLGVDLEDVSSRTAEGARGAARVTRVYPGSGAASAGLQAGDVLLSADGRVLQGRGDLNAYLASYKPGRPVELHLRRGTNELDLTVTSSALEPGLVDVVLKEVLGLSVVPMDNAVAARYRFKGVVVEKASPNGSFARAGGRAGDVISEINGQPITSPEDLRQVLLRAKSAHRGSALVTVWRGNLGARIVVSI